MFNLTSLNKKEFSEYGATILKNFFSLKEIQKVEEAIDLVSKNPSPMIDIFEKDVDGNILFFNDFNNWRRIPLLKEICLDEKIGNTFKELTGSKNSFFFHDHIICKRAGATKKTPWHLDKTYFMLDGSFTASFWIPTISLSSSQSLSFAKGSHKDKRMLMPKSFNTDEHLEVDEIFTPFKEEDIEKDYQIVNWDMKKGDALVFTFYTIHSAPSCVLAEDRKALSLRVVGDDTTFDSRVKNPAPPFTQMGYKANHGDLIRESWFPRYD